MPGTTSTLALSFAHRLRTLRDLRGHTQLELAEKCDLSVETIRRIEAATLSPTLKTIECLCDALDVRPATLFESEEVHADDLAPQLLDLIQRRSGEDRLRLFRVMQAMLED